MLLRRTSRLLVNNCPRPISTMAEIYNKFHYTPTPITVEFLTRMGKNPTPETIVQSAQILHREVPIRIARRIVYLEQMPCGLSETSEIQQLKDLMIDCFTKLNDYPQPTDLASEKSFREFHHAVRVQHSTMFPLVYEALQKLGLKDEPKELTEAMDRFYSSRIANRILIDHHDSLHNPLPGYSGIINTRCSPREEVELVVRHLREAWSGDDLPPINVVGGEDVNFMFIPSNLQYMVMTLLQRAVTSVRTRHAGAALPAIEVVIAGGANGVTIKVEDQGGGVAWSDKDTVFNYLSSAAHTTSPVDPVAQQMLKQKPYASSGGKAAAQAQSSSVQPFSGFEMCIARVYARYYGGDAIVVPMEGRGQAAFVYLPQLEGKLELDDQPARDKSVGQQMIG